MRWGIMTNTSVSARTIINTRPGEWLQTGVSENDVPSVRESKCFVTIIDEASGHDTTCVYSYRMITKKSAELLKRRTRRVEQYTDCWINKIVLDGGKEYVKESMKLDVHVIDI